jgi:hypothetical protein
MSRSPGRPCTLAFGSASPVVSWSSSGRTTFATRWCRAHSADSIMTMISWRPRAAHSSEIGSTSMRLSVCWAGSPTRCSSSATCGACWRPQNGRHQGSGRVGAVDAILGGREMTDDKEERVFVTVLRSPNANYVDVVASMLEAEGIPCQHPGKNHAALIPGLSYIDVELRVPVECEADARALIEKARERPDEPAQENVAFRVVRSYGRLSAIIGFIAGAIVTVRLAASITPSISFAILGAMTCAGYLIGRLVKRRSCSRPGCAAVLNIEMTSRGKESNGLDRKLALDQDRTHELPNHAGGTKNANVHALTRGFRQVTHPLAIARCP